MVKNEARKIWSLLEVTYLDVGIGVDVGWSLFEVT